MEKGLVGHLVVKGPENLAIYRKGVGPTRKP